MWSYVSEIVSTSRMKSWQKVDAQLMAADVLVGCRVDRRGDLTPQARNHFGQKSAISPFPGALHSLLRINR
jgi:hypothetical protein